MFYRYKIPILLLIALAAFSTVSTLSPGLTLVSGVVIAIAAVLAYYFLPSQEKAQNPPHQKFDRPLAPHSVEEARKQFDTLTEKKCIPQSFALEFMVTENPRALDHYFPIVKMLTAPQVGSFYQLVRYIAEHPNFDIHLLGRNKVDITDQLPSAARYLVAGHLAEVFFFRRDLLTRFLHTPRHFYIYVTPEAFKEDAGVSGGDYNPTRESIQLVMSRLYEGFNGITPGPCPFLHELGHMLDHFDAGTGSMGRAEGLYPGLRKSDGKLFTPLAREAFIKGKRLERDRYLARFEGDSSQPMPIGHPYVFKNDGEFAAGYLEMFFRNPNYFAKQNPDLYAAYSELFGYDPRQIWKVDYPHYVEANRSFYSSGQKPPQPGLTIPQE